MVWRNRSFDELECSYSAKGDVTVISLQLVCIGGGGGGGGGGDGGEGCGSCFDDDDMLLFLCWLLMVVGLGGETCLVCWQLCAFIFIEMKLNKSRFGLADARLVGVSPDSSSSARSELCAVAVDVLITDLRQLSMSAMRNEARKRAPTCSEEAVAESRPA